MLYELSLKQRELDKHINKKHNLKDDHYDDRKVWLLVELGELANELRFFKYASEDKKPRMYAKCDACKGSGKLLAASWYDDISCPVCHGSGEDKYKQPVLEEYVDTIHLVLSLANIIYKGREEELKRILEHAEPLQYVKYQDQFNALFYEISNNLWSRIDIVIMYLLGLGKMIGFTNEQIVEAYNKKNKKNHSRQENGY